MTLDKTTVTLTVAEFLDICWGLTVDGMNPPGRRKVTGTELIRVSEDDDGCIRIRDGQGEWITERICGYKQDTIGLRDWKKLLTKATK